MGATLSINDYMTDGNIAEALRKALAAALESGADRLVLDGGRYILDPLWCSERSLCYSNHDKNGPKRIGALIENMSNIELDFGGAVLECHGIVTPVAIIGSSSVTVRNLTLENPTTGFLQVRVTGHNADGSIIVERMCGGENLALIDGHFYVKYPYLDALFVPHTNIEYNGETGEIEYGTEDNTLGVPVAKLVFTDLGFGEYRIEGGKRKPPVGNILVISATRRLGAGFFIEESENLLIENVTIHSCYGMGLIAQMSKDITLRRFCTLRNGEQYYTSDADATHFVNCTGTVTVEDSTFEGQLDDALNIHGIYTKIVAVAERELTVREMHHQSLGIKIYKPGDRIQILEPETLLPYTEKTVESVDYINSELISIKISESTSDVRVGDDVESLDRAARLVFRGNVVRNNRARGMLIATRAPALIENCYFHTSGTAIKFESDGKYWYESGGTTDVTIRGCKFDRCKHGGWGDAVIECKPREATVDGQYFHKKINVEDNEFIMYNDLAVYFDNVAHAVFLGNEMSGTAAYVRCNHVGTTDFQLDGLMPL